MVQHSTDAYSGIADRPARDTQGEQKRPCSGAITKNKKRQQCWRELGQKNVARRFFFVLRVRRDASQARPGEARIELGICHFHFFDRIDSTLIETAAVLIATTASLSLLLSSTTILLVVVSLVSAALYRRPLPPSLH